MKKILHPFLIAAALLVGCKTLIPETTIARIQQVAQAAASVGVAADVLANKEHRPFIVALKTQLDTQIATGTVTSAQLAAIIVNKLPLDPSQAQYFNGALVLWGITSLWWVAPNANDASMAAAVGLSAGIDQGLAAVPSYVYRAQKVMPPKPSLENVKKI